MIHGKTVVTATANMTGELELKQICMVGQNVRAKHRPPFRYRPIPTDHGPSRRRQHDKCLQDLESGQTGEPGVHASIRLSADVLENELSGRAGRTGEPGVHASIRVDGGVLENELSARAGRTGEPGVHANMNAGVELENDEKTPHMYVPCTPFLTSRRPEPLRRSTRLALKSQSASNLQATGLQVSARSRLEAIKTLCGYAHRQKKAKLLNTFLAVSDNKKWVGSKTYTPLSKTVSSSQISPSRTPYTRFLRSRQDYYRLPSDKITKTESSIPTY